MKNKGIILAALFAVLAFVGGVTAYNQYVVTRFNDLRCTDILLDGNDILDSSGTTRITVGSTVAVTGNETVSGTLVVTGATTLTGNLTSSGTSYFTMPVSTAPRDSSATIGTTPTAAGQLVYNSTDRLVCASTGTTRFTWVLISSATPSACTH